MVMLQKSPVSWREHGCVTEVARLVEGDIKKFGRGVYLKERGHYECKIWESMSKQRT